MLSSAAKSARRKRKNRIKQLKRSLEKYKLHTSIAPGSFEYSAYNELRKLKRPQCDSNSLEWGRYRSSLEWIVHCLQQALITAAIEYGASVQREETNREALQAAMLKAIENHKEKEHSND
jgi:hypothetical protein